MLEKIHSERLDYLLLQHRQKKEEIKTLEEALRQENHALKEKIISGQTTGNLFKDWALVNFGSSYQSPFEWIPSLQNDLSKEGELVLVSEDWKVVTGYLHRYSSIIHKSTPHHDFYRKTWVGLLSSEGLKVQKHLYLTLKKSDSASEEHLSQDKIACAQAQPLVLALATQPDSPVYFERRKSHVQSEQEFQAMPIYLDARLFPHLEFHQERAIYLALPHLLGSPFEPSSRTQELTYFTLAAGRDLVLTYLASITHEPKIRKAKNLEDIHEILTQKKKEEKKENKENI